MTTVLDRPDLEAEPDELDQPDELDAPSYGEWLWGRLVRTVPGSRAVGWLAPLTVALLAFALRLYHLSSPTGVIFDEVYYSKDSFDLLRHGVELNKEENGAGFIVHPPVGKWMIAAGQWVFGHNELGWRISAAVVGALSVLVIARVARRMFRSTLLGCVAGVLLALDALEFVQSRVALLDIFLMFWLLAAFACLVADRDQGRRRLAQRLPGWVEERGGLAWLEADPATVRPAWPGPGLGVRWWRLGMAVCGGLALAVKWDAVFVLPFFFLLAVAWDVGARRTGGVPAPVRATALRDLLPLLAISALVPAVLVASWAGWFANPTYAYDHDKYVRPGQGALAHAVAVARGWGYYQYEQYHFHTTLDSRHPYQSKPLQWLLLARPVSYFYNTVQAGSGGCPAGTPSNCSREILGIGTPAIWWAGLPAMLAMLWRWVSRRDWRAAAIVVGWVVTIAPWMYYAYGPTNRTMFQFYALPTLLFIVLALTYCVGLTLGRSDASRLRRGLGAGAGGLYLAVVAVNFFGLLPILTAETIPYQSWIDRMWFHSWI